jgi:hypothetical protein
MLILYYLLYALLGLLAVGYIHKNISKAPSVVHIFVGVLVWPFFLMLMIALDSDINDKVPDKLFGKGKEL